MGKIPRRRVVPLLPEQRIKADRFGAMLLKLVGEGQSYGKITHRLGLSKNTVLDIIKRDRAASRATTFA
jgi:transposase